MSTDNTGKRRHYRLVVHDYNSSTHEALVMWVLEYAREELRGCDHHIIRGRKHTVEIVNRPTGDPMSFEDAVDLATRWWLQRYVRSVDFREG